MPKDMQGVMEEYETGQLHSGSKKGPKVTNRKQAIAIGLSEQRQMAKGKSPKRKEAPMGSAHPGFKAVAAKIAAKSGESMANAGAILASSSRNASPAAKKKNPRLKKVKGGVVAKKSFPGGGSKSIAAAMNVGGAGPGAGMASY